MPKFYAVGTEPDVGVVLFEFESRHDLRSFFLANSMAGFDRFLDAHPKGTHSDTCHWSGIVPSAWEGEISSDAYYRDVIPVRSCDVNRLRRQLNLTTLRKTSQTATWVLEQQELFRTRNPLQALAGA